MIMATFLVLNLATVKAVNLGFAIALALAI